MSFVSNLIDLGFFVLACWMFIAMLTESNRHD